MWSLGNAGELIRGDLGMWSLGNEELVGRLRNVEFRGRSLGGA
jgi:hypothetical protein